MNSETFTTTQASQMAGKPRSTVLVALSRHSDLRPATRFNDSFVWTRGEVDRLIRHFATAKRGRPKRKASI